MINKASNSSEECSQPNTNTIATNSYVPISIQVIFGVFGFQAIIPCLSYTSFMMELPRRSHASLGAKFSDASLSLVTIQHVRFLEFFGCLLPWLGILPIFWRCLGPVC